MTANVMSSILHKSTKEISLFPQSDSEASFTSLKPFLNFPLHFSKIIPDHSCGHTCSSFAKTTPVYYTSYCSPTVLKSSSLNLRNPELASICQTCTKGNVGAVSYELKNVVHRITASFVTLAEHVFL